jgi:multiple sugar transport system permease protein
LVASFSGIFGLIYVMTNGGPGSATTTLEFAVWTQAFAQGSFGMAAAFGIVLMVLTLVVVGVVQLLNSTVEEE